jgi:hypothetical protein
VKPIFRSTSAGIASLLLISGCGGRAIEDNWPTYEVRGIVRTSEGIPVAAVLVELETYTEAACGEGSLYSYGADLTDVNGQYRVQQDEPMGTLSGCLRLVAHVDSSSVSEPTAVSISQSTMSQWWRVRPSSQSILPCRRAPLWMRAA